MVDTKLGKDDVNINLLKELTKNSRMKNKDIAHAIHMSESATSDRMQRMEKAKIIKRYCIEISLSAMGVDHVDAMLRVKLNPKKNVNEFFNMLKECVYVQYSYPVCDGHVYILLIKTPSVDKLKSFTEKLGKMECAEVQNTDVLAPGKRYHDTVDILPAI